MSLTAETYPTIVCQVRPDRIAVLEFSEAHEQNPFSRARMRELRQLLLEMDADDRVSCIVLYGGAGRSFGAGGDFNEVSEFHGGDEVDDWIDDITDLYSTIAGIAKPVVAAVDAYAIGVGLQIMLCCDYRIASSTVQLIMPEFRVGIACTFGGYMLETVVGRSVMQQMMFTCEPWNAARALADRLVHEVVAPDELVDRALARAQTIASYSSAAVQGTRPRVNRPYVEGLERVRAEAKVAHRRAFAAGDARENMRRIIGKA